MLTVAISWLCITQRQVRCVWTCVCVQNQNLIQAKVVQPNDKKAPLPVSAFIVLERNNSIRLVQYIHAQLASLSKVIRGTQLLTNEVQNLAIALMNSEVTIYYSLLIA